MDRNQPFDRAARRLRRNALASAEIESRWLQSQIEDFVEERIADAQTSIGTALVIGASVGSAVRGPLADLGHRIISADAGFALARRNGGVQCDEDMLPFADNSFDVIACCGALDSVNDLPGALALFGRMLKPNGFLVGSIIGAPSLTAFKTTLIEVEMAAGAGVSARTHPQIDLRSMGDLLLRAGFRMPVLDTERVDARYARPHRLLSDLKSNGLRNCLSGRASLSRKVQAKLMQALDGEPLVEQFSFITFTGWWPADGESLRIGPLRGNFQEAR